MLITDLPNEILYIILENTWYNCNVMFVNKKIYNIMSDIKNTKVSRVNKILNNINNILYNFKFDIIFNNYSLDIEKIKHTDGRSIIFFHNDNKRPIGVSYNTLSFDKNGYLNICTSRHDSIKTRRLKYYSLHLFDVVTIYDDNVISTLSLICRKFIKIYYNIYC